MSRLKAVLFDLDDTLLDEAASVSAAFRATAAIAAEACGTDVEQLHQEARRRAREIWWAHPDHDHAGKIGISSWEALWARFLGDHPVVTRFRRWAPTYRRAVWHSALERLGHDDDALAGRLAERFPIERRARHRLFPEARAVLGLLRERGTRKLALLTNGLSCLQREKIHGAGLEPYFDAICVSGDLGVGKPDPIPFRTVLGTLGVEPYEALMVGDNPERDIGGAHALGFLTVQIEQGTHGHKEGPDPDARIGSLDQLPAVIESLDAGR